MNCCLNCLLNLSCCFGRASVAHLLFFVRNWSTVHRDTERLLHIADTQFDEIPPRVEYELTDKGLSVVPILQTICRWAGAYHKNVNAFSSAQCKACDYTAGAGD